MSEALAQIRGARPRRYRPYTRCKDSGVDWLGQIPVHWEVKRLKFIAPATMGKVDVKPDDAVYIGLEHVESWTGRLLLDNQPDVVDSVVTSFKAGDVLFGKLRPYLAKAARPDFDGVCTSEILPLRPAARCSQSYLMYCLLSAPHIRFLDSLTYGTKMPRLSPAQIGNSFVPVPPLEEQHAVAGILDRETSRIDGLVARKERLIELLQEKRTALITHAVTRGLDPSVQLMDSGIEWVGEIPEHWEVSRIKWVARMESGHTPDKKIEAYWRDGDVPWLSLNDTGFLKDHDYISETAHYTNELGLRNSSARLLPAGAVVFSRDATIGLCAITERPIAVSQHFIAWLCGGRLLPEYLLRVFDAMQGELERLTMGATLRTIGMPHVKELATPIPPVSEQEQIVAVIRTETAKIDALIVKVRKAIDLLKEFRTALISAAVTGKIDVRDGVP
ncbi:MAG: restriction endonuclease subunit S [Gemmatimonadota bacterium]